jgi:hypothetical protein
MKKLTRTGTIVVAGTATLALASGGVAFAYWTSSGSSTGTAAAGTTSSVTIVQTLPAITGLYPGGTGKTININITNPNSSAVTLAGVTATVSGTSDPGCTAADFSISGPVYAGGVIAGGATIPASGATISMLDRALVNQDACKGATISLAFAAN